jgi:hypothetical protein
MRRRARSTVGAIIIGHTAGRPGCQNKACHGLSAATSH